MSRSLHLILILLIFLFANTTFAKDEPVEFKNKIDAQRYQNLTEEVRCLVCQNQSLADSNADLAQDLRKEIYDMIISGKQDEQIISFLVERYGDFVLYRPPLKENTWLLWFGPVLFLIIGLITAVIAIKKQAAKNNINEDISEEQKQRLAQMLKNDSSKGKQ